MVSPPDTDAGHWSRYWQAGAGHSCAGSFGDDYGGEIARFWQAVFATLGERDRVLDVGSGNGPLARLLLQARPEASISCDAVDVALVQPDWVARLDPPTRARLRFHARTPAEALPFDDASFDVVVSQYGIEYSDLDRSTREALRVLRRPARVVLLLHHAQSRPVRLAHDERGHIAWLERPDGLLDCTRRLLPLFARAATDEGRRALAADAQAESLRARFNDLQRELADRAGAALCPDVLYETRDALARLLPLAVQAGAGTAGEALQSLRHGLTDGAARLADLCRCALDASAVDALQVRFGPARRATRSQLHVAGHLMGWTLDIAL